MKKDNKVRGLFISSVVLIVCSDIVIILLLADVFIFLTAPYKLASSGLPMVRNCFGLVSILMFIIVKIQAKKHFKCHTCGFHSMVYTMAILRYIYLPFRSEKSLICPNCKDKWKFEDIAEDK